ncbi:MAG: hypothetical protein LM562_00370 [Pyrobaculum sp.]|nr:hypothetical protein [Pyrobaculum sp.]
MVLLVPNHKLINLLLFLILGTFLADTFSAQFSVAEEILNCRMRRGVSWLAPRRGLTAL